MSKSNAFENDMIGLIFNGTSISNIARNAGTAPLSELQLALHTSDPGEGGSQNTNECNYTGYARAAVARNSSGFTVTGNQASLTADIEFPSATGGTETITHFSVGTNANGAGKVLYRGTVSPTIAVTSGVTPRLTTGTTITEN